MSLCKHRVPIRIYETTCLYNSFLIHIFGFKNLSLNTKDWQYCIIVPDEQTL